MRIRFDRGTLVLEAEHDGEDPSRIPGAAWDERTLSWRVPADRHASAIGRLSDAGGRFSDECQTQRLEGAWSLPELRWYQHEAIARWSERGRRGVIALPTGSGKTLVALGAIAELGVHALIVVPTRVLLDQWIERLSAVWPHPIGRLGDGDHQIEAITVATYASAVLWVPRIGDRFGIVIVDEAHHVGAWCPHEIFEMLVAPARLGLTATPPDDPTALVRHVGPVVYSLSVDELKGKELADYQLTTIPIQLTRSERVRYRDARIRFSAAYGPFQRALPGSSWNEFVRAARRTAAGRDGLAGWREARGLIAYPEGKRTALRVLLSRHAGQRTLVFTADNATAYAIARELLVMPITHEISRPERAAALAKFRSGELTVLVSSQVLDEGLDVPDAEVAIVVGGTASKRRHVQRVGRILRPRPGKRAHVYELAVSETTEVAYVERRRAGLSGSAAPIGGAP
ncbi:MAG: DEAD/DEAH box helicase [Deltaproteobacteria bacterium]|nr:DEAD/DEAH box helicase [Deltaproteobacteria bacterium]